jgi:hypothetical protein
LVGLDEEPSHNSFFNHLYKPTHHNVQRTFQSNLSPCTSPRLPSSPLPPWPALSSQTTVSPGTRTAVATSSRKVRLLVTSPFPLLPPLPSPSFSPLLRTIPTNTPLGDYASTIYQTLDAAGQPTDANAQVKALFNCVNNGAIQFIRLCEGNCVNEPFGSQVSDHC